MMVLIASCEGIVWAVSSNGDLWFRAGISQNNPMGSNWFKMETRPNAEAWKQAVMYEGALWGIDGADVVRCKEKADQDQILPGNSITVDRSIFHLFAFVCLAPYGFHATVNLCPLFSTGVHLVCSACFIS